MIRRPPRSTLFPLHDALPISIFRVPESADCLPETDRSSRFVAFLRLWERRQYGPSSPDTDRKSTRLNSSHANISYAVFCLKKKTQNQHITTFGSNHTHVPLIQ